MDKLRILWICHFSNNEIQSKLPIWKKTPEFAPWIPSMAKGFANRDDIELHVLSPQDYLRKQTSFIQNNIHYHLIPYGIPLFNRHWPQFFPLDVYTNFFRFRKKTKKIVTDINPDLINLIGAENAYYSATIFDFKDTYPILVSIQGFITQMKDSIKTNSIQRKRIKIEERIHREFMYFTGEQDSSTYISSYNPNHQFFKHYYSVNEDLLFKTECKDKIYDCLFYGRINKEKGIEDFIRIVAELKKTLPDIKACVIGPGDITPFKTMAQKLDCLDNIEFAGFMKSQMELFEKAKSSKVFLIPSYFDRQPTTLKEAMYMKVPVVAYASGGIPYINEFDENIYLLETGDYIGMSQKVLFLLRNEKERIKLAEKAYIYALNEYGLKINTERLIAAYKKVINK